MKKTHGGMGKRMGYNSKRKVKHSWKQTNMHKIETNEFINNQRYYSKLYAYNL